MPDQYQKYLSISKDMRISKHQSVAECISLPELMKYLEVLD